MTSAGGEGVDHGYRHGWRNRMKNYPDVVVTRSDRDVLRGLADRVAEIAALPIQAERRQLWKQLNELHAAKPMVWLNDICWSELNVHDELTLQTSSAFCREIETELRQRLYWWTHMPGDMVVDPVIHAPLVVHDTGIGIEVEEDTLSTDSENEIVSHGYHHVITDEHDLEKIRMPVITHHERRSEEVLQGYEAIFEGVLHVHQRGFAGFSFSPWDHLVKLTGVEEALLALALRPEFIHKLVGCLTQAALCALDQLEEQNLLSLNNRNLRIGSGAYGYTDDLPAPDFDGEHVRAADVWGFATAQIFSEVSPDMHEEFALHYERKVLSRFGLVYYGCCEPLFRKMHLMRTIPNLRKVSASPWNDFEKMAEEVGGDYVISLKPNPEILARDGWDLAEVRRDLKETLTSILRHGCSVEMIMKDISTVRHQPRRLWEWTKMASELSEELAVSATV
jgi:hypothetical protein